VGTLSGCALVATGTTGALIAKTTRLDIELLLSGPLGGDAQAGAMLVEHRLDLIVFFWDPLTTQPHDVDVKALLRLAVLYNVPIACNRATADFLISSPLLPTERSSRHANDRFVPRRSGEHDRRRLGYARTERDSTRNRTVSRTNT